jgi:hypothetical protein
MSHFQRIDLNKYLHIGNVLQNIKDATDTRNYFYLYLVVLYIDCNYQHVFHMTAVDLNVGLYFT